MKTKRIRTAFDRALTGLASLTTHGASSSTYLSACVARSAETDILEQRRNRAVEKIAASPLPSTHRAMTR